MRHVLGLPSSRSTLCLPKPSFSPYRPLSLLSTSRSTLPSTSIRKRKEETLCPETIIYQISRRISRTADRSEVEDAELLHTTEVTDTAAAGQEKGNLSDSLNEAFKAQGSVQELLKAGGIRLNTESRILKKTTWKILNPAFNPHLSRDFDNKMHSHIQFITTPTSDTPGTALLLHFDNRRYIIGNAHEGLHRASLQMGARVLKTKDIFLTGRTEWQSKGGLMGLILTIADATTASAESKAEAARIRLKNRMERVCERDKGMKKNVDARRDTSPSQSALTPAENQFVEEDPTVRLHGGPNLTHTLATARSFIFRKGTPIKVLEHVEEKKVRDKAKEEWEPTWSDPRIQVWAMPIKPTGVSDANEVQHSESPRKRSLGEYMSGYLPSKANVLNQWPLDPAAVADQDERNQKTRELAVSEMFSSLWGRDNLIEMPLRDVQMPAVIHIRDPVTKKLIKYEGPTPDGREPVPDINVLVRKAWPGALIDHLPPTKRSQIAMTYIIRNHRIRGKFNPAAAKELKVPRGPCWAALAAGSSVQSSDGLTVTPDMVLGPSKEGSGVAVVDLPSSEYVHDLINRPEWRAARIMSGVVAVIWILGPGVVRDMSLIRFIKSQPGVEHIISSPEYCPDYITMTSAATMAIRHHQIDPARYAVPLHSNAILQTSGGSSDDEKTLSEVMSKNCRPAGRGLKIILEPHSGVTEKAVTPFLNTALVVQGTPQSVLDLARAARQQISTPAVRAETSAQVIPSPNAEIICLGTGSAMPSQYRNVAATLLRVPGCGSYLMDCGENTLGQLRRMYTGPQLAELLHDLKLIWISHLHADHHLGLTSVIKAWYEGVHGKDKVKRPKPTITEQMLNPAGILHGGKRLFVVGHEHMIRWLEEYSSVEDYGHDQLVPLISSPYKYSMMARDASSLGWNGMNVGFKSSKNPHIKIAMRRATGLSNLVSCPVSHCRGAQAVSLTFPTGFKFSYSGDCRPSQRFAEIGRGSTVLVHEATFDDDLKSDAVAKKHSTTSEAIGVGVAMGARRVILTHFSQRYQKIPSMNALDTCSIRLEDGEDIDDLSEGMESSVEEPTGPLESQASIDKSSDTLDDKLSEAQAELQPQKDIGEVSSSVLPSSGDNVVDQNITPEINSAPRPQLDEMRIGVAFDHMCVKVRDIMHLDKFTPALVELYKDEVYGGTNNRAAKEAFSDDENDILQKEQRKRVESSEKRTQEEKGERARKGQIKAAKKRAENQERQAQDKREEEDDEKSKVGAGSVQGVEVTEPVMEKIEAVQ